MLPLIPWTLMLWLSFSLWLRWKMFFRFVEPVFLLFDVCNNEVIVISGMGLAWELALKDKAIPLSTWALKELQTSKRVFLVFFFITIKMNHGDRHLTQAWVKGPVPVIFYYYELYRPIMTTLERPSALRSMLSPRGVSWRRPCRS